MGSESGASVRGETKKVITFIGLGIVAALAVGLLVWQFNTPFSSSSAESGYCTTNGHLTAASEEVRDRDEEEPVEHESGADTEGGQTTHAEAEHQPVAPADDPLLPPHAVSPDRGAQASAPTRYYRPTNVGEPTRTTQGGEATTAAEPTPGSSAPSTSQPATPTPSAELTPGAGQTEDDMGIHRTEAPQPTGETSGRGGLPEPVPSLAVPTTGLDSMDFPRIDEWSLPPRG